GVALFVAPDDATALAAATSLRSGAVVAPSGLLVLPGLVRLVEPRARAERDAAAQLRAMASRLRDELAAAERARAIVQEQRVEAERRLAADEERLAIAQRGRSEAERVADELATAEADVRDLVRAREASASAVERERADVLVRRERLAQEREAAKAARTQAADAFGVAERDEQAAVDLHNAASRRAEDARLDAATCAERRASGVRLRDAVDEQVRAELGLPDDDPLPDPASIAVEDEGDEKERASTLAALQRLRRRLIALEPVNPLAATELAEIGKRHGFLTTQKADLERAMADLRTLADELATTIAEQFSATLQAVDREFGLFFQRLFHGGQASLRTSDDPEEPGIDIYARPPGKRIGSLAQLSGGERALTATALLLAILRVRPAPFCVLDEVDAALDERNVGRFTQALRELTDR